MSGCKDWERTELRACAEGLFCEKESNTCCFYCDEYEFCGIACDKVDYTKNVADVCDAYKEAYPE